MLLKIEVFPAGEPLRSTSSSTSTISTTTTTLDASQQQQQLPIESSQPPLYVCLSTSGKPASKYDGDNDDGDGDGDNDDDIASDYVDADAGRLLTVGRSKVTTSTSAGTAAAAAAAAAGDKPMVLIPASDKSVSREHCLLRLVASKAAMEKKLFAYHPRPMSSRNEQEEEACLENEKCHNLCVVVESMGKLGTYLVVEPDLADATDDTPSKKAKNNNANSEDDETDEEDAMIGSSGFPISQQQQTQQSKSQASVLLPALSDATKQIIGPHKVSGTTLVPIENSLVLEALNNNSTGGRVILQCGKMGSTVVITRVALHFVQAGGGSSSRKGTSKTSGISNDSPWYKRLYMIGATEGETVTWNNNNNNNNGNIHNTPTTLVLTPSYNATPKQLAAWSRGIPLVTPDFMQAMLQRSSPSQDALPKFQDFMPKADGNAFWNNKANSNLWSGTVFLSTLDASASSTTSSSKKSSTAAAEINDMLVASAGATIVRLYEMSTDQVQDLARRLETDTTYAQSCFGLQHASASSSGGGRGVRRTKSSPGSNKSDNSVVALAAAKLLQDYNIPLFSTRTFAKLLTGQQPLTTDEGRILGCNNNNNASVAAVTEKTKALLPPLEEEETSRMVEKSAAASRNVQEKDNNDKDVEMQDDSSSVPAQETPPVDSSASNSSKRRRQRDDDKEQESSNTSASASQQREEESASLLLEQCRKKQRHLSPVEEEPATSAAAAAAASKNDKEALRTLEEQPQKGGGGDKNEKMASSSSSRLEKDKRNAASSSSSQEINQDKEGNDKRNKEKSKSKNNKENNKNSHEQQPHQGKRCSLAASTTKKGWLVAAPSKTSKRQAYLRSRDEIKEQLGYEDIGPVAETEVVKGLLRRTNTTTTTSGQGQQRRLGASTTGPDFKRFWKNEIAGRETNARPAAAGGGRHGRRRRRPRFVLTMASKNKGDSIMQAEFHEERQALEEEQRKADQLFCDPGSMAAAAPRRRRKA